MISKYVHMIEERQVYSKTGKVWTINDVPRTWRENTEAQVIADGFYFAEDGTAYPLNPDEEE